MTFDEYQAAAARTANTSLTADQALLDAAMGLAEEGGEVLGLVRKHAFFGHPLDRDRLVAELGDALWCLTAVAARLGVSLGDVAGRNVEKLRRRYPEGFTEDASRARTDH